MQALLAERPGMLSDVLALHNIPDPGVPGEGEVTVRMIASTINPSDAVTVSGAYGSRTQFPFIPGFEGVGIIESVGPGVPVEALGKRVLPIGSAGNWQEVKLTAYSWCIPVPDDIPDTKACFAYINPLTAWLMVEQHCSDQTGQVAITGATTTIASHLAEFLYIRGIQPVGIIRGTPGSTVANRDHWSDVIKTSHANWAKQLQQHNGKKFDLIFDCVGGQLGATLMRHLAPGGVFVHYGLLSGEPLPSECFTSGESKRVEMFRLRDTIHSHARERLPALFTPVFEHMRAGRLHTEIAASVPLSGLPTMLTDQSGVTPGKVLISYA